MEADSMTRYEGLVNMENTCVAYGSFESVHKGHLKVAETVAAVAKEKGLTPVVVSVPVQGEVFTTEEEKEYLLKDTGVEVLVSAVEVDVEKVIKTLGAKVIVVGETSKDLEAVKTAAEKAGVEVVVVETVKAGGEVVSLEGVKAAYLANDYVKMTELCGHPYVMLGEVVHGKALGRTQGMPTANLGVADNKIKPQDAVYCTRVLLGDETFKAMTNIGKRPSVDDFDYVTIEAFILDFKRDIYGQKLVLEVHKHVRGVVKFNSLAEVRAQIDKDIQEVRDFLDNL